MNKIEKAHAAKQALRDAINVGWKCGQENKPQYMAQAAANAACSAIDALAGLPTAAERAAAPRGEARMPGIFMLAAWVDVIAERQRQVSAEGWTPAHDDEHDEGELSYAAAGYAVSASDAIQAVKCEFDGPGQPTIDDPVSICHGTPWPAGWEFRAAPPRRMLVKAAALLLAEIERIDRAAQVSR